MVYRDDIIIHSMELESHRERVDSFLEWLPIAKLKLKVWCQSADCCSLRYISSAVWSRKLASVWTQPILRRSPVGQCCTT